MRIMPKRIADPVAFLALLALIVAGCEGRAGSNLAGRWAGSDPSGETLILVFDGEGGALWIRDRIPGVQDTFNLRYQTDTTALPKHIDLSGFMEGPLAGMTLYGIYEVGGDTVRLDFEAALPGQWAARPDSFTAEAVSLIRTR